MNAIRNAITTGSGWGNSGNRDNPNIMLASVTANVKILSIVGTRARWAARFVFCFSNQSLKPEEGFKLFNFNFNDVDLKPYFTSLFLKFVVKKTMSSGRDDNGQTSEEAVLDIEEKTDTTEVDEPKSVERQGAKSVEIALANIEAVQEIKRQVLPKQTLICIGEYPAKILIKGQLPIPKDELQQVFIDKTSEEIGKWGKDALNADQIAGLDANVDTQFWYQVMPFLAGDQELFERLRSKLENNKFGALILSSLWDGIGSAMSPTLISKLKEWKMNTVTLALFPSRLQPSAAQFNALASIGKCLAKETAALILLGRDQLDEYVGVDRTGSVIKGNIILNSIVEMMLAKTTFVLEFSEISRSFGVKTFTILAATGASLKIYGSLENILDTTLFRPLQAFDLSGASLLYVLVRLPIHLKEKLNRDKIELIIADWFKDKAVLKSVYVTEPLYVEDVNDRVDLLMFVGGFNLKDMVGVMEKKAEAVKTQAVKLGALKEEEWKEIVKSLA